MTENEYLKLIKNRCIYDKCRSKKSIGYSYWEPERKYDEKENVALDRFGTFVLGEYYKDVPQTPSSELQLADNIYNRCMIL